ncbi:hypothetical protein B0J12DRAFT_693411 [Macrophomina phaseolina]|uniref:CENP-V/GFA domain-containing protein n=1 Tax=Macrophomina phaseolina TaxID=35725 RepID=A0ABQ8GUT3_9PEZI|nr:hypothetical protein B0J12DRAFT_693411 [Macrophomina phaseolina]
MGFPEPTDESSQHSGHCHCGAVRFRFALSPPLDKKKDFKLEASPDGLGVYTFGEKRAEHTFCKTCGSSVYLEIIPGKGPDLAGVDVRMMDDVDMDKLVLQKLDGKSYGQ